VNWAGPLVKPSKCWAGQTWPSPGHLVSQKNPPLPPLGADCGSLNTVAYWGHALQQHRCQSKPGCLICSVGCSGCSDRSLSRNDAHRNSHYSWLQVTISVGIIPAQTPVTAPTAPYTTNQAPWLTLGTYAAAVHALNTATVLRLHNQPPMGRGGFFWLTRWPWAWSGGQPNIYWASPGGQLSSHAGLCKNVHWTAGDRDARLVIM